MTAFQTNLDIATLEFNKSLQVELQAYFNATKNTISKKRNTGKSASKK